MICWMEGWMKQFWNKLLQTLKLRHCNKPPPLTALKTTERKTIMSKSSEETGEAHSREPAKKH